MTQVEGSARRASNSRAMKVLARFGLTARGFVFLLMGWLAIQIARGHGSHQANQRGALADIAHHSYGIVLLWVLGFGFAAYAIWCLSQAIFGAPTHGKKAGPRLLALIRGIVYGALSVTTFTFIAGVSMQGQSQQQATLTARIMKHDNGRWLVGGIGLIVVVVGLVMVVQGVRKTFEKQLRMQEMARATRTLVVWLGVIGNTARGIVFAIAGALATQAAVTFDPAKSKGLDGALRTLADRPYGPWLLGILALGLIAFGLFGLAAARWAKV
jgi:Domain of Unknown Function (DUF1206)